MIEQREIWPLTERITIEKSTPGSRSSTLHSLLYLLFYLHGDIIQNISRVYSQARWDDEQECKDEDEARTLSADWSPLPWGEDEKRNTTDRIGAGPSNLL